MKFASEHPAPQGSDVEVLFDESRFVFDGGGRCVTSRWLVARVLTTAGLGAWGTTSAIWSPWHQERPSLRARVIGTDGSVHELDQRTIEDAPASSGGPDVFDNRRIARAPLPALEIGAVVEEESVVRDASPFFDRGVVVEKRFGRPYPVRRTRMIVEVPADLPVMSRVHLLPDLLQRREDVPGGVRFRFDQGPLAAIDEDSEEPLRAPDDSPEPSVSVTTGRSWSEVAAGYGAIVDRQIAGANLKKWVQGAVGKARSHADVARALLRRLRLDVRYTGVEFDEAAIVPRSPEETLRRKFGDCKDQAALLVAALRAAGVPADVALVRAGSDPEINPDLPGMGVFDHAIVRVAGDPPLWIDPTSPYADAGELPTPDQGRQALVASGSTRGLERTPDATPADNRAVETREFALAEQGPSKVVEVTEVRGAPGRQYRASYADADPAKIKDNLERYARERYLAKAIAGYETSDARDLSTPFRLRLEIVDARRGTTVGDGAAVAIEVSPIASDLPEWVRHPRDKDDASPRTHDVFLPMVYHTEWNYRIVPPPGYEVQRLPETLDKDMGPAHFSCTFKSEKDAVVLGTVTFEVGKRRLTPDEAGTVQKGVRDLGDMKPLLVTFQSVGAAHLEAGRVREALDEFGRLAALHPKESLHRTQIARALLAGGMGEAARAEARGAVAAEPSSAVAQRIMGWVLTNDLVGRPFHKGCDLAGAEAAYRKSKELDSSDAQSRANLAILLEYDADLVRYGPGARLAEAIQEYRSLRDDLSNMRYDENLLIDLTRRAEFDEVKRLAAGMPPGAKRNAALVVATAAMGGLDGALRESSSLAESADDRRALLLAAARWMMALRLYPQAAGLFVEAAKGASNGAALLSLADILRKTRRHEDMTFAPDDPGSLLQRLVLTVANPVATTDEYLAFFPASMAERDGKDFDAGAVRRSLRTVWAGLVQSGVSVDVAIDVALSMIQPLVEGNESLGYRIRVQMPSATTPTNLVLLAIRENGSCRIVAFGNSPWDAGHEVLRRVDAGDLEGARRWLDWTRDALPSANADDPLEAHPFAQFWSQGAAGEAGAMRAAAASLMASTSSAAAALPILQEGLQRASSDAERLRFDAALRVAYSSLKRSDEAIASAKELLRIRPDSSGAFDDLISAFVVGSKWEECRRAADERLKRHPDDLDAERKRAGCTSRAGDLDGAGVLLKQLVDSGRAEAPDLNNLAWLDLARGAVNDSTVEMARRAVMLTHQTSAPALHTLASIYAETGKPAEARENILQAMDAAGVDEPEPHDWYVFGRIAEQYGVTEAAISAYRKVTPPTDDGNPLQSTYTLARKRLALLEKPERPKARS